MIAIVFVTTTALSAAALLKIWVTEQNTDSTFASVHAFDSCLLGCDMRFAQVFNAKYTVYFIKYSINFALLS